MDGRSLRELAEHHLAAASESSTKRSAETVYGGREHRMRQTLVALMAGAAMQEHESPGEATVQVLQGRVRVSAVDDTWEGEDGDHLTIPSQRHSLEALTDAAVLLTVVTGT